MSDVSQTSTQQSEDVTVAVASLLYVCMCTTLLLTSNFICSINMYIYSPYVCQLFGMHGIYTPFPTVEPFLGYHPLILDHFALPRGIVAQSCWLCELYFQVGSHIGSVIYVNMCTVFLVAGLMPVTSCGMCAFIQTQYIHVKFMAHM